MIEKVVSFTDLLKYWDKFSMSHFIRKFTFINIVVSVYKLLYKNFTIISEIELITLVGMSVAS